MLGKANLGAIIQGETVLDGTVWEGETYAVPATRAAPSSETNDLNRLL